MSTYILQIDTATEVCSVSLSLDGQVVQKVEAAEPNLHASNLTLFIEELLRQTQITFQELAAVAVSKGPGSYTGLRIGVSTAKGLCYALDIPLLAVNTLESMYNGYATTNMLSADTVYVPMLDARRMEVYMMIFDSQGAIIKDTEAVIMDNHKFEELEGKNIVLFGSGAAKLSGMYTDSDSIRIASDYKHSSVYLAATAFEKYQQKDFEDLIYFEPYYLKEFMATIPKSK